MSSLERAGKRAGAHSFFQAARLTTYQQYHELSDEQLAAALGCLPADLARLRLCRVPTTSEELARVAALGQVDAQTLAGILQKQQ